MEHDKPPIPLEEGGVISAWILPRMQRRSPLIAKRKALYNSKMKSPNRNMNLAWCFGLAFWLGVAKCCAGLFEYYSTLVVKAA